MEGGEGLQPHLFLSHCAYNLINLYIYILENARVALVGRASEVLECARAFKRPRIQNDHVFKTTTYSGFP